MIKPNNIRFTKMHGLGNDFMIIDAINQTIDLDLVSITLLSNRHLGVGFDQLLIIDPPISPVKSDFFCRIFNADGSEAEQCGNGLRCVARFIREHNLYPSNSFNLATKAGIFPIHIKDNNHISVMMGIPHLIDHDLILTGQDGRSTIGPLTVLSLGNPHAILPIKTIDDETIPHLGQFISKHSLFPQGVNVGFMQIMDKQSIRLRTIERGAGETLACGSNAAAAVASGMLSQQLASSVEVEFCYGSLMIEWEGLGKPIKMIGPATHVFMGEFLTQ